MTCERYEREGRLLVERGLPDPHLDDCADCRLTHRAHAAIVAALPAVGDAGDPAWQAAVWRRIRREERAAPARRGVRWPRLGIAAAAAAAAVLAVWWLRRPVPAPVPALDRPRIEILSGAVAMRSTSARIGDRVRVSVGASDAVWMYRGDALVVQCPGGEPGCRLDVHGAIAELDLVTAGDYQIVTVPRAAPRPTGVLDRDLAAVVAAGGRYRLTELVVR